VDFGKQIRVSDFGEVKEALLSFKQVHGHLVVPFHYVVPFDDPRFSQRIRGMKLGNVVHNIRNQNNYKDHREELVEMGFVFRKKRQLTNEQP
jgi:hypothetical protein